MSKKMLVLLAVIVLIILGGCAKSPQVPDLSQKNESFDSKLAKKYQELKKKGSCYIKKDPQSEKVREKIEYLYNSEFIDCFPVSIGLQFILIPQEEEFTESMLAVSSESAIEFAKRFLWYQEHIEHAEEFLDILSKNPAISRIIREKDSPALEIFLEKEGVQICSVKTIVELLQEVEVKE